jgi:hypothetical protein
MEDILDAVQTAQRSYNARAEPRKKVHEWLAKVSSRIMHYSQALDMLAQHHPEYVALVWGAMKFVLMVGGR